MVGIITVVEAVAARPRVIGVLSGLGVCAVPVAPLNMMQKPEIKFNLTKDPAHPQSKFHVNFMRANLSIQKP